MLLIETVPAAKPRKPGKAAQRKTQIAALVRELEITRGFVAEDRIAELEEAIAAE